MEKSKFIIANDLIAKESGKGFQMTFANGNTISVMFGIGNYCSNKNTLKITDGHTVCNDAEIAIWNSDGNEYIFGNGDSVEGYCTTNEVAQWINCAANNQI